MINTFETQLEEYVSRLTPSEYLKFIIRYHYSQYYDKQIMLSVYDKNHKLCFTSKLMHTMFNLNHNEIIGKNQLEMPHAATHEKPAQHSMKAGSYALAQQKPITSIIFDRYNDMVGALYSRFDPIFMPDNSEVCGYSVRSYNYTKLFWGVDWMTEENEGTKQLDLTTLTQRQHQVLFLLALNFTQDKIANSLAITRGSVSKLISQICNKFDLPGHSAGYLLKYMGRKNILKKLEMPGINFFPVAILIEHEMPANILNLCS